SLDVTDVYTTDAKLRKYDFLILEDDRHFFPAYGAVLVYRADLEGRAPAVVKSLLRLEGKTPEKTMIDMNARAEMDRVPDKQVAADFLAHTFDIHPVVVLDTLPRRLLILTAQHLRMVALSLALAIVLAIPLGVAGAQWRAPRPPRSLTSASPRSAASSAPAATASRSSRGSTATTTR